jgi:hypothetical protein
VALVGLLCLGCASAPTRPEILTVRDPDKLCRVVAFSRCAARMASSPASAFVDTGDVTAVLGL